MAKSARNVKGRKRSTERVFCTTCGDALQDYCFSPKSDDLKQVIKDLARCKAQGRFKGKFCAKLFIAGSDGTYRMSNDRRPPRKKLIQLRQSILAGIEREERRLKSR